MVCARVLKDIYLFYFSNMEVTDNKDFEECPVHMQPCAVHDSGGKSWDSNPIKTGELLFEEIT